MRFALLCLLLLPIGSRTAQPPARQAAETVRIGMTAAEVRERLGAPTRTSRQLLYHRYFEQWLYLGAMEARLEFRCAPGQEARLQNVRWDAGDAAR